MRAHSWLGTDFEKNNCLKYTKSKASLVPFALKICLWILKKKKKCTKKKNTEQVIWQRKWKSASFFINTIMSQEWCRFIVPWECQNSFDTFTVCCPVLCLLRVWWLNATRSSQKCSIDLINTYIIQHFFDIYWLHRGSWTMKDWNFKQYCLV